MADFQVNAAVVCDDVRKEMTNKDLLIGVYGSEIIVHALPSQVRLAFWMELSLKRAGKFNLYLKIDAPTSAPDFELRIALDVPSAQVPIPIFTPPIDIPIEREGKLRLWAKSNEKDRYELVKSRNVRYQPPQFGDNPVPPAETAEA